MARTARMARRETRDSSAMWEKNKYVVCCLQTSRLRGAQPALHRVCKVFDVLMRDADASIGHSLEPLSRKSLSRKSQGTLVTNAPDALCFLLAAHCLLAACCLLATCCLLDGHMIVDTRSRAGRPEYRIPLGEPLLLERASSLRARALAHLASAGPASAGDAELRFRCSQSLEGKRRGSVRLFGMSGSRFRCYVSLGDEPGRFSLP